VPTVAAMKELVPAWAHARNDVLEIRRRARCGSESRRIEQAAFASEEGEAEEAATDLEAARADVLVWQTIAREVEDRPQENRFDSRPARGTGCGACRDVERNDHTAPGRPCVTVVSVNVALPRLGTSASPRHVEDRLKAPLPVFVLSDEAADAYLEQVPEGVMSHVQAPRSTAVASVRPGARSDSCTDGTRSRGGAASSGELGLARASRAA